MGDEDSDIEFYSFIQVNEDLSNADEQQSGEQQHSQVYVQPKLQQVQKEVTLSTSNTNEDLFFKKLSYAFYSTATNSSTNLKENKSNSTHGQLQTAKINLLENQSTQPHTPLYASVEKHEDNSDTKNHHHLLKNYQIKKVQKNPNQIEVNSYDTLVKKRDTNQNTSNSEQIPQNALFQKSKNGMGNHSQRYQPVSSSHKQILVKKNLMNNLQTEQYSYDLPQKENQMQQLQQESKQYNSTANGFYTLRNSGMKNGNTKLYNDNTATSNFELDREELSKKQENLLKQAIEQENIDTIILGGSSGNSQDRQESNGKQQYSQKSKYATGEKKYDFMKHFAQKQGYLLQQQPKQYLPQNIQQKQTPYIQEPQQFPNNGNKLMNEQENNDATLRQQIIESYEQKKSVEINSLLKPQLNPRKSVLQINKEQAMISMNNMIQRLQHNGDAAQAEDFSTSLNNNYIKIGSTNKIHLYDTPKDEKILFSGRKIKQNQSGVKNKLVANFNAKTTAMLSSENNQGSSLASKKSPSFTKLTPQLKKTGTLILKEKGFTTPRSSLQATTGQSSSVGINNYLMNSGVQQSQSQSSKQLFQQPSLSSREENANTQQKIQLSMNLNKPSLQMNASYKKFGLNQNSLLNQMDANMKFNKTIKDKKLLLTSNITPTSNKSSQRANENFQTASSQLIDSRESKETREAPTSIDLKNSTHGLKFKGYMNNSNKYMIKNELIKMPLNSTQKLMESAPLFSIQNSNNQSLKYISTSNIQSSNNLTNSNKKKIYLNSNKKVESIYTCEHEEDDYLEEEQENRQYQQQEKFKLK